MKSTVSSISKPVPLQSQSLKHWMELVVLLVKRDLKVRYRGSFAGYLWTIMNPLILMLILTLVFSTIGRAQGAYFPLYVLSGILAWNVFSQGLINGANSIHSNAGLLKKVRIPHWVFPSVAVLSALVNMIFALLPYVVVALVLGFRFSPNILLLPLLIALFFLFLLGFGLVVGTLNVMFRDVGHMLESGMLILFYSAPIGYPLAIVPDKWRPLLAFHPLYFYLKGFRTVLSDAPFQLMDWAMMSILSVGLVALGTLVHVKLRERIFYYL